MLSLNRMVSDPPDGGQHPNRTLAVGPDNMLYVSVASSCNSCPESNPLNGTIQQFALMAADEARSPKDCGPLSVLVASHNPGILGHGDRSDGGGDNLTPEELIASSAGCTMAGRGATEIARSTGSSPLRLQAVREKSSAPQRDHRFSTTKRTVLHSSSLPIMSGQWPIEYRNDAFVTMRGSWNRERPTGYKVVRLRFMSGQPTGFEDFITGWLSEDGLTSYGRPTGLAFHTDGSMLISDDHNGVIYRVSPGTQPAAMVTIRRVGSGVGGIATTNVSPGG